MIGQQLRHRLCALTTFFTLTALGSGAMAAQPASEAGRFEVYFAGLKAGEVHFAMTQESGQYAATGEVRSSGLIAAIARFRYRAEARGRVTGETFTPTRYEESLDTGRRQSDKVIAYRGGVPVLEKSEDPEDHWLDPARQGDALDPLTAFYELLRAREGEDLCQLDTAYFDGERRIRLTTAGASRATGRVTCTGRYIREGGFSRKALKEGRQFPFEVTYTPGAGGRWQVSRIDAKTLRGRVLLIRR
ncbi:DUF3108 domain-containing protein [Marinovum sp.]|uniref:DUF3108 domain-containing protein n=1 Tax=Marinovum sp. TaxID=2024839 RepID=UPI002B26B24F|nr:DUF3108 domain-containing protein [Marinovum sp.]